MSLVRSFNHVWMWAFNFEMKIGKEASLNVELKMKQKILYDPLSLISASCWKFSPKMNIRNFKLTVMYISIFLHITWFSIDAFLLSWKYTWPSAIFANNRISQELTTKNIEFLMFSAINYINNKGFFFGSLHGKELYDF